jgi:hypothetical protein
MDPDWLRLFQEFHNFFAKALRVTVLRGSVAS